MSIFYYLAVPEFYDSIVVRMINQDMMILIEFQITLVDRNLVHIAKDGSNLFEWYSLGIGEEEDHDDTSDGSWNDEDEIEFPTDVPVLG